MAEHSDFEEQLSIRLRR